MVALGLIPFAAVVAVLVLVVPASAQTSVFGLKLDAEVELGGRGFIEDPGQKPLAVIEPYRDLSEQPYGAFRLDLTRPDETFRINMGGDKIGQQDQEFFLTTDRTGLWRFDFDWNQIPHYFPIEGRSPAVENPTGSFNLPTPRPRLPTYNTSAEVDQLTATWYVGKFSFTLAPSPDWDLALEYTRIHKTGDRPFSMAFGSPGNNFFEVLQPLDQTVHDFRLRASWSGSWWSLQGGYTLSVFNNNEDAIQADNPCFGLPQPINAGGCAADANGAPSRGQASVAPSNMANTLWVAGAINLPLRSRIAAEASYSLRTQDATFLPETINPRIQSPALPANSLDGSVGTFLLNVTGTSQPTPPLNLTLRYRLFNYDTMTDELVFPQSVLNDRTLENEARRAVTYGYFLSDLGLEGRWRFGVPLALTLGGGWQYLSRSDTRETETTNTYAAKAALDTTPWDWFLARLTYAPSFRRIGTYNTFARLEHLVVEEGDLAAQTPSSQSLLNRKFDEANRNEQAVKLLLQFTPADGLTVTPTGSYLYDDYYDSPLGLQSVQTWSAGFDVSWAPSEWLSIGAGYLYEKTNQNQESQSRPVVGTNTLNFADFAWISDNIDTAQTVYAGLKAALIPKKLDWLLNFSYQQVIGKINTFNPIPPTSGTPAQNATATAKPFPEFVQNFYRLETSLRYRFWNNWSASLGYIFDLFTNKDFQTNTLTPFQSGVTSIWLGPTSAGDTAQILYATVGYRFP